MFRNTPQVCEAPSQYHPGPGPVNGTPEVWYVKELGRPRSVTEFLAENSREGSVNEHKLRVRYEVFDLSFISSKSASAPEEVPLKGVIKTLQHEDKLFNLMD